MDTFTIQFRMTKKCNAECTYCIAPRSANTRMSVSEFKEAIDFLIQEYLPFLGAKKGDFIDAEFVGGEISLLPFKEFSDEIDYARSRFNEEGYIYKDGCQSNLIGSEGKLIALWNKFDGSVSTSIDNFSEQRLLKGSSELYREKFRKNIKNVCGSKPIKSVFVLDKNGLKNAKKEAELAILNNYQLGMYPAYEANNPVSMASPEEIGTVLCNIMDLWVMNSSISIEPLWHIFKMVAEGVDTNSCNNACPFMTGCAKKSICIEPNGDIYVCMDMAETKNFKIGNSINGSFDKSLIRKLGMRGIILDKDCIDCQYNMYCKGGCLNSALINSQDIFSKTYFCKSWKMLFVKSEEIIKEKGRENIIKWLDTIEKSKLYC